MTENYLPIIVAGRTLPSYQTAGAAVYFTQLSGKDVTEIATMSDNLLFLYCRVKAACRRERIDFDIDFETFACDILPKDLAAWTSRDQLLTPDSDEQPDSDEPKKKVK